MTRSKRIYVLDTNILMHDPTALFKFEEHDVFIPMMVLEELDNGKKRHSESSRNARQVSRFLNELVESHGNRDIAEGIALVQPKGLNLRAEQSIGKLHFQLKQVEAGKRFGTVLPDNLILGSILQLKEDNPGVPVVLVSKDINLRIKASICGVAAEDYENDRAIDDFENMIKRQFDVLYREGEQSARVMAICLHPYLIGVPHRFASFERMLDLLMKSPQVCFKTGGQIADWYTAQVPAPSA